MAGHNGIVGTTECGKSTLGKILAWHCQDQGIETCVLDPLGDPEWDADHMFRKSEPFIRFLKQNRSKAVFIDEGSISVDRHDETLDWLGTLSRQWGHRVTFIGQRAVQYNPTIRGQWTTLFAFSMAFEDAKELSKDFIRLDPKEIGKLQAGEFIKVGRFMDPQRFRIDFKTRKISPL